MYLQRLLIVSIRFLIVSITAVSMVSGLFLLLHSTDKFPEPWRVITFDIGRPLQLVVIGCILLASALLFGSIAKWWESPWEHRIFGALGATAPFVPGIAAVITLTAYIGAPGPHPANAGWLAVLAGILAALYSWLLLSLLYQRFASADSANPRIYHEICVRWDEMARQLDVLTPPCADPASQMASAEACAHRDFLARELGQGVGSGGASTGFRWTSATGYIDLWNRLHRLEEALILLKPTPFVVSQAHYDQWRLRRSNLGSASELLEKLESAIGILGAKSPEPHAGLQEAEQAQGAPKVQEARAIIREVRRSLNEYRGDRQAGLVRARNRLVKTGTFTALWGYIFFSLAILADVGKHAIIAATAFFLVGACIGLFNQLLSEASTESAIEDYGLSSARLLHIPLFSGLAALGGVVLIPMLIIAMKPEVMAPGTLLRERPVAGAGIRAPAMNEVPSTQVAPQNMPRPLSEEVVMRKLRDIFDLESYPFGLVIAALFGLTPRLLTDRLKQQTDRYTDELKTTQATEGTGRGAT
jgi:hypothetical protein